jgi:hypothetical protein
MFRCLIDAVRFALAASRPLPKLGRMTSSAMSIISVSLRNEQIAEATAPDESHRSSCRIEAKLCASRVQSRDFLWFCDATARGSSTLLLRGALELAPSFGLGQCNQPLLPPSSRPTSRLCCAHPPSFINANRYQKRKRAAELILITGLFAASIALPTPAEPIGRALGSLQHYQPRDRQSTDHILPATPGPSRPSDSLDPST